MKECFNGHKNLPNFTPCMAAITRRAECIPHELADWAGVACCVFIFTKNVLNDQFTMAGPTAYWL